MTSAEVIGGQQKEQVTHEQLSSLFAGHVDSFEHAESVMWTGTSNGRLENWTSLLRGFHPYRAYHSEERRSFAFKLRGFDHENEKEIQNQGKVYVLAKIDAQAFTLIDDLLQPERQGYYAEWYAADQKQFSNLLNGYTDRIPPQTISPLRIAENERYANGMTDNLRLYWVGMNLSGHLEKLDKSNTYRTFMDEYGMEYIKNGAKLLELDEKSVDGMLNVFAGHWPERVLQLLAHDTHELVSAWAESDNREHLIQALQDSDVAPAFERIIQSSLTSGNDNLSPWEQLIKRLPEAGQFFSSSQQQRVVGEWWFGRQIHKTAVSNHTQRQVSKWLDSAQSQSIKELGEQAAATFHQQQAERELALERTRRFEYPEALRNRQPDTPITLIALNTTYDPYNLSDKTELAALLSACQDPDSFTKYIRQDSRHPDDIAQALEEVNVNLRSLDEHHFAVVDDTPYRRKLKIDTYAPETMLGLLGLSSEDLANHEIVVVIDKESQGHLRDQLAEGVLRRTGKYPHFAHVPYFDHYEGTPMWQINEYVPVPATPKKPTLEDIIRTESERVV